MAWVITDNGGGIKFVDGTNHPINLIKSSITEIREEDGTVNVISGIAIPHRNVLGDGLRVLVAGSTVDGVSMTTESQLAYELLQLVNASSGGSSVASTPYIGGSGGYVAKPSGSNADASATYTSPTTITLAGTPFTVTSNDIGYIAQIPLIGKPTYHTNLVDISVTAGVITLTGATFAATDRFIVGFTGIEKAYDSDLDVTKVIPQARAVNSSWSEPYTEFTPTSTSFVEGNIITTKNDSAILLQYSKTASDADDSYIKAVGLDTFDSVTDYQQSIVSSPVGGESSVETNLYLIDKAADITEIYIPTNGRLYMRLDVSKKTDTGTDPTFTCNIVHIPRS